MRRNLWARGYYVTTVGNVNEETVREYIKNQEETDKLEDDTTGIVYPKSVHFTRVKWLWVSLPGVSFALCGAACMALFLILTKKGSKNHERNQTQNQARAGNLLTRRPAP